MNNTNKKDKINKVVETIKVLAEAWDDTVNGHLFTIRVAEMLADGFDN